MKKLFRTFTVAALVISLLASCQKDEFNGNAETVDGKKVTENVVKSFNKKYPGASNVIWENKAPYWVAHFDLKKTKAATANTRTNSTWFDDQGNWQMSEHDIDYEALPAAIRNAFEASKYASWKKDDVQTLERDGVIELYMIEVEQENGKEEIEMELYYTTDGVLTKEVPSSDDHTNLIPEELPEKVKADLDRRFEKYELIEVEKEEDEFEVEVLFNGNDYELKYDVDLNWVETEYDIELNAVPANVLDVLKKTVANLEEFEIDDIEVTETKDGLVYEFELEHKKTDEEIEIRINDKGEIVK